MGARVALLLALLASACAPTPRPAIEVRTVTVKVPTPVACVDPANIPADPETPKGKLTGNAGHDVSILAAYAIRLRAALDEALALFEGCRVR